MQRAAPIIIVVALLVAATAAFVRAETLKAQKAPVYAPDFAAATFSPTCRCPTRVATMRFRVRPGGAVRVDVIDADGSFVRRLELVERDGSEVVARWAGLDRRGALAPDGDYRLRVKAGGARAIAMPNRIILDTRAPAVEAGAVPKVISPDGNLRNDRTRIAWDADEQLMPPTRVVVAGPGGTTILPAARSRKAYAVQWPVRGSPPPAEGEYAVTLVAVDAAGNEVRVPLGPVHVRYVVLGTPTGDLRPGGRLTVPVDTDARRLRLELTGRGRTVFWRGLQPPTLSVRLPADLKPGLYALTATQVGEPPHRDTRGLRLRRAP